MNSQPALSTCNSCGAMLQGSETCSYCGTVNISLPLPPLLPYKDAPSPADAAALGKFMALVKEAISLRSYELGYGYCNKALEITRHDAQLWLCKALCAFWINVKKLNQASATVIDTSEILFCLNAAHKISGSDTHYNEVANEIGANMSSILIARLIALSPDRMGEGSEPGQPGFGTIQTIIAYIEGIEAGFDLMVDKDVKVLKPLIFELSNQGKLDWYSLSANVKIGGLSPIEKRSALINKAMACDFSYVPPAIGQPVPETMGNLDAKGCLLLVCIIFGVAFLAALKISPAAAACIAVLGAIVFLVSISNMR